MATTFVEYTGDGNANKQFTFPSYQESDVKVRVDGVLKTTSTHYNITNYTTTGGGTVEFTSGNIPSSPANIRIYRDTNVDAAKATFTAGSSVKAADLNNNTTQLLYRAQEEQIPNLIHSYDIDDSAIETSKIKADAITSAKIADDQINSEHYVDGSIDTQHIADSQITSAKIADGTIVNADINASAAIAGTKIAPDFGSQNIATTGTVDGRDVSADGTKLDGIETGATADQTAAEIRTLVESATDSNVFTDADHTKLNGIETGATADQTNAEIRAAVEAATDSNVFTDADHSKLNAIEAGATADQTASEIKTLIASSPLDSSHLAANSVTTSEIADGELTTLAGMQSTTASNLASSTALTATTAELNQLDGITLETSLTTNSDTRIPTSKAVNDQILAVTNALGGFVAIADEISFPTSNPDPSNNTGTVVSISQITNKDASGNTQNRTVNGSGVLTIPNAAGSNTVTITGFPSNLQNQTLSSESGLQVQTTSTLHTYTFHKQLASAADIQAISATVNSFSNRYRVSASAPTSSLDGGDLWYDTTNSKLMVYSSQNSAWEESSAIGNFFISTISSSSNTGGGSATANGTAYRFTISDAPVSAQQLLVSVDGVIQKPNSGSSQPSEGFVLVGNDIIFGAAPANGASLFVTVIGSTVGIGTPSNNTVTTAILQNGSVTTAKIVDASVTTAKIATGAVTQDKIGSAAVVTSKLASDAVTDTILSDHASNDSLRAVGTNHIKDEAVTLAKLEHGTSSNNGKFLRANNGADPSFETVAAATGSQYAIQTTDGSGNFTASNTFTINGDTFTGHDILLAQDSSNGNPVIAPAAQASITLRTSITQSGAFGSILDSTGLQLGRNTEYVKLVAPADQSGQTSYTLTFPPTAGSNGQALTTNGSGTTSWTTINSDLVADTTPQLGGNLDTNGNKISVSDDQNVEFGASGDLYIKHSSGHNANFIVSYQGDIEHHMASSKKIIKGFQNSGTPYVALYHNNNKKFETTSGGIDVTGTVVCDGFTNSSSSFFQGPIDANDNTQLRLGTSQDLQIFHDGTSNHIKGVGSHSIMFWTSNVERWYIDSNGHYLPAANGNYDIGTSNARVRNLYTSDLHLSNEAKGANDVDGTWGDWTIQEGESDLFLKNNRSGKKYKFNLTEVS